MSDKTKFVRHILFNFYNDGKDGRSCPNHLSAAKTSSLSKSSPHSLHHCADMFMACVNEASFKFMVFFSIFDQNFIIDALKVFG